MQFNRQSMCRVLNFKVNKVSNKVCIDTGISFEYFGWNNLIRPQLLLRKMADTITKAELLSVVVDKRSMYNAALRNGYFLPDFRDQFVTMKLLTAIKNDKILIPKTEEIRLRNCVTVPPKIEVAAEVIKLLEANPEKSEVHKNLISHL